MILNARKPRQCRKNPPNFYLEEAVFTGFGLEISTFVKENLSLKIAGIVIAGSGGATTSIALSTLKNLNFQFSYDPWVHLPKSEDIASSRIIDLKVSSIGNIQKIDSHEIGWKLDFYSRQSDTLTVDDWKLQCMREHTKHLLSALQKLKSRKTRMAKEGILEL